MDSIGVFHSTGRQKRIGQVHPRLHKSRVLLDGCFEFTHGFRHFSRAAKGSPQIIAKRGVLRHAFDGLAKLDDGLLQLVFIHQ